MSNGELHRGQIKTMHIHSLLHYYHYRKSVQAILEIFQT
eukprot:SAG11_NODE_1198_length_5543_cov_25.218038_2_plen_39_part_00